MVGEISVPSTTSNLYSFRPYLYRFGHVSSEYITPHVKIPCDLRGEVRSILKMETLHYYAVASDSVPVQLSFILGVLLHITLFRHGEWDLKAKALCLVGFATYVLLFLLFICAFGELSFHSCVLALLSAQKVILAQLLGLTSSIMIYRMYFHRLCKFPGPILASITGWYHTYLYARRGHLYEEIQELHKRYGPVVRVGQ